MCRLVTARLAVAFGVIGSAFAQTPGLDWRHIGNSAMELALPSVATGPFDRVWFSPDGTSLFARTISGRTFQTTDFEQWKRVMEPRLGVPPIDESPTLASLPEDNLKLHSRLAGSGRLYTVGRHAYRSDDGGLSWSNLTAYKGVSILGKWLLDVAASPKDPDEIAVAANTGVWHSLDGGLSWTGLNQFLPNLPRSRLSAVPSGTHGVRLSVPADSTEIEWAPGEKIAWRATNTTENEARIKAALSEKLKNTITAVKSSKDYIYAGDSEGRLMVSADAGVSWGAVAKQADGPVEAIWIDPNDARVAVAAIGGRSVVLQNQPKGAFVLKTMNGGIFWDDITANLPDTASAHGVVADRGTGTVYAATDAGLFMTSLDLASAGRPAAWTALNENLPTAPTSDVMLDAGGNQLYVVLDGYGVYAAIAPHRFRDARLVNAADYSSRPAAPGALLSVLGAKVDSARAANVQVPVFAATDGASQIQVPFEATGSTVSLTFDAAAGTFTRNLALQNVSPAIFVDPEGTPIVMDASSGILLDATKPAHANTRIQVLATGLGRVKPEWPTGLAAPLTDSPRVVAPVRATLDGLPLEVVQAGLAPGYVGFYLIEVQLPKILNAGPAELVIEAEGEQSNHVRLYIEL
jgi:uncharacterized protein (TIGR03437 family)